jgi:ATP adenylyltransferase
MITGSGFGALRILQNVGTGQKEGYHFLIPLQASETCGMLRGDRPRKVVFLLKYFPLDPSALPWETRRNKKAGLALQEDNHMTFEELTDFLKNRMRLSHIYQPLLIRSLVDAGGLATLRQLANSFLTQDESQLIYYEKRIKEMPLKVLSKHGVVQKDGNLVSLTTKNLSLQQKAQIRMLCEQAMQDYVRRRGLSIWDYRLLDTEPVTDSVRYQVLKASGGRCALCGAPKRERPLDVDHIKPRSKGGANEAWNLQVLCSTCNRSKRDKNETDFRGLVEAERDPNCPFCETFSGSRLVEELGSVVAIKDQYPVTDGHLLVITRRHTPDYFTMTSKERADAQDLLRILRNKIAEDDTSVTGFNVGANCGESAGQTIWHAHVHLIPRRDGDTPNPRGGVRGVIPEKMGY